jgi:hypothetical protein
VEIVALESFCGVTVVAATDGCSVAEIVIRSDTGRWATAAVGCVASGATPEAYNPGEWATATVGAYKITEYVSVGIGSLPVFDLPAHCPPPYTSGCATCYGEVTCPHALAAIAHLPTPCLKHPRGPVGSSWPWREIPMQDDVPTLQKYCTDYSTMLFGGNLVSNRCFNYESRHLYLVPGTLLTYKWEC